MLNNKILCMWSDVTHLRDSHVGGSHVHSFLIRLMARVILTFLYMVTTQNTYTV